MKPPKLIISLAIAICAFSALSAYAQTATTNTVNLTVTMTTQASIDTVQGTNTSYTLNKPFGLKTADIISELGLATAHNFSTTAKLVIINSTVGNPTFAVIDGGNFVDVSGIMSLNPAGSNPVQSGIQNGGPQGSGGTGLAFPTLKQMLLVELDFNDVGMGQSSDFNFSLRGIASGTTTDTKPSASGIYTETMSVKISNMSGDGSQGGIPFVATGIMTASGKGNLSL
jgi:hypothetical protein